MPLLIANFGSGGIAAPPGGGGGFTPLDLSAGADLKFWHSFADVATLFQDAAGTLAVTTHNDPIGLAQDKSGNGNHVKLLAGWADSNRPLYQTDGSLHWSNWDGNDDRLGSADLASTLLTNTGGWMAVAYEATNAEKLSALVGEQRVGSDFQRTALQADTRASPNRHTISFNGGTDATVDYPAEQPPDVRTAIVWSDGGTLKGYHNGSLLADTAVLQVLSGTTRIDMGWAQGLSHYLAGKIFEACGGAGTLTPQDIADLTAFLKARAGI